MKLKRLTACVTAALTLIGCANLAQQSASPSSYRFDYRAMQRVDGVIRAFDDGRQTIVQFVDLEKSKPMFAGEDGSAIEYELRGQYALLPAIIPGFSVKTPAGVARFEYTGDAGVLKEKSRVASDPAPVVANPVATTDVASGKAKQREATLSAPAADKVATGPAEALTTAVTTSAVRSNEDFRAAPGPAEKVESVQTEKAKPAQQVFAVLPSDTLLIPVLVRWAEAGELVAVLNGRQVTSKTLEAHPRADLPLPAEARSISESSAALAIFAVLKTYASYRSDVSLAANFQPPNVLSITSSKKNAQLTSKAESAVGEDKASTTRAADAGPARFDHWAIDDSASLRAVVEHWGQRAGLRVQWESNHDFPVTEDVRTGAYSGTFKEALGQLAKRFGELPSPISMKFSQDGLVLRVTDLNAS